MIIVDVPLQDPYRVSNEYRSNSVENDVRYAGESYFKKITYEKSLSRIYRLGIGILSVLAALLVVPRCFYGKQVSAWWQTAKSGIDRKIVLIKKEKGIQFNSEVQILEFDKGKAPNEVKNQKPLKGILKV